MPKTVLPSNRGTRVPLSLRITADLRKRLEASAERSGRNLTQEVEWLLENSINPNAQSSGIIGGRETHELLSELSRHLTRLEKSRGRHWFSLTDDASNERFDKELGEILVQLLKFERVMHMPPMTAEERAKNEAEDDALPQLAEIEQRLASENEKRSFQWTEPMPAEGDPPLEPSKPVIVPLPTDPTPTPPKRTRKGL